ncbi:Astacin-like metalloprotease toxin, partial [Stegodyphus mimosarum]
MKIYLVLLLPVLTWGAPKIERNPMENEGLFEGDIMAIDPDSDRNAVPRDSQRWPAGVVPYELHRSVFDIKDKIAEAMQHIQERSCIRFVRRTNEKDYVKIYSGNGCWSFWGRMEMGEQELSLGYGCEYLATIIHELMHAIGFEHEHNRSDRDDYLYINWYNIPKDKHHNFKKLEPQENRLLSDFDFDSIMLYGSSAFSSKKYLKSMEAKDGRTLKEVHDKPGLS